MDGYDLKKPEYGKMVEDGFVSVTRSSEKCCLKVYCTFI